MVVGAMVPWKFEKPSFCFEKCIHFYIKPPKKKRKTKQNKNKTLLYEGKFRLFTLDPLRKFEKSSFCDENLYFFASDLNFQVGTRPPPPSQEKFLSSTPACNGWKDQNSLSFFFHFH